MRDADARARELGDFLRTRRTALTPTAAGLAAPEPGADGAAPARRTPGLRRRELADLAGVSTGYYTRLEQGRAPHPSMSVLGALARALRLDFEEQRHLFVLAGHEPWDRGPTPASEAALRLLDLLAAPTGGYLINRYSDVLAWNDAAEALFPYLRDTGGAARPNSMRFVFLDPAARTLFADWEHIAADSVAHLRAAAGHLPGDARLAALIGELHAASPEFRRLWTGHGVKPLEAGRKDLLHPAAGRLSLDFLVMSVPADPGQRLIAFSAPPGSPSHESLLHLAERFRAGRDLP